LLLEILGHRRAAIGFIIGHHMGRLTFCDYRFLIIIAAYDVLHFKALGPEFRNAALDRQSVAEKCRLRIFTGSFNHDMRQFLIERQLKLVEHVAQI